MLFVLILSAFVSILFAQETAENEYIEQDWAIGALLRYATIPFATGDRTVASFVPMMFFEGERFFLRGIEGGYAFYKADNWKLSAMGRMRFFDFPKEYQNLLMADNVLWGLQFHYEPLPLSYMEVEALSDLEGHFLTNLRAGFLKHSGLFHIETYLQAQLKTAAFNNYYYGLTVADMGPGIEWSAGVLTYYHLLSNLYLFGTAKLTFLDKNVRSSELVNRDFNFETFIGFGFANDRSYVAKRVIKTKAFIQFAHGWATPSSLADIIHFRAKKDTTNNKLTTLFYGHPLTDNLFGFPLDFYLMTGLGYHWPVNQAYSLEAVVAIKAFYTFSWPIRWRLGATEGMSYVNRIPYVEKAEMERKNYRPSNLMNYLNFSLDFNIGDIFGGKQLKRLWLGYTIHHRSSIFESAQQFGRIKGGSNFQQFHFLWNF